MGSPSPHDHKVVLTHMAVAIADGADCLSEARSAAKAPGAAIRLVASHATAGRAIEAVDAAELRRIDAARAVARSTVWAAGAAPETL